jgi:hypothetical protein
MMENTVPNFHREEGKNIPAGIKRETKNKMRKRLRKRKPHENRNGGGKTKYYFTLGGGGRQKNIYIFFSEQEGAEAMVEINVKSSYRLKKIYLTGWRTILLSICNKTE